MTLAFFLFISVASAFGMATLLVNMKKKWPITPIRRFLKPLLSKIHPKMGRMLQCAVCTSFWTTFVVELLINLGLLIACLLTKQFQFFWLWPLSGFITAGLTWVVIDFLNSHADIGIGLSKIEEFHQKQDNK